MLDIIIFYSVMLSITAFTFITILAISASVVSYYDRNQPGHILSEK